MNFCKEYNAKTADKGDLIIPVEISAFEDRSFAFVLKTPPASVLLAKAANVAKGSGEPNKTNVGSITQEQLEEIAKTKLPDLNARKLSSAMKIVEGTAKNMGITITT
jgi:large subunit ribosomal protein L11